MQWTPWDFATLTGRQFWTSMSLEVDLKYVTKSHPITAVDRIPYSNDFIRVVCVTSDRVKCYKELNCSTDLGKVCL